MEWNSVAIIMMERKRLSKCAADEGINGTNAKKYESNKMIEDCKPEKLVITKSISRFARNILDALTFSKT
jgi:hypothetical protein